MALLLEHAEVFNCFLLLEEPLALSLRERRGRGLGRGRQAVAWPCRIAGFSREHDRMVSKAPIPTRLRRKAAGDACVVGAIGAREDGSGAGNRRTTAAAIEDLHGDGVGGETGAAFRLWACRRWRAVRRSISVDDATGLLAGKVGWRAGRPSR